MGNILKDIIKELDDAVLLRDEFVEKEFCDSGSYALNKVLSGRYTGGYPLGGLYEICGESSSAKTVFLTHAFVGAQKDGWFTVMVDNEHAYAPEFAEVLGVDPDNLIYGEPTTVEQCFQFLEDVVLAIRKKEKDKPILLGFDSIGTPPSEKEMEGKYGDNAEIGGALRAKAVGIALRRFNSFLKKNRATLIIINQFRSKVGFVMGDPNTKAGGGRSLEYYCGISMVTSSPNKGRLVDELKNPVGIQGKLRNTKNKHAIPYQSCEFELIYDKGLTRNYGLHEVALKDGTIISPSHGNYSLRGDDQQYRRDIISDMIAEKIESGELE